jgi:hypothetical protein
MDEIIRAINHALDCGKHSLTWYSITGDIQYMDKCKEWNEIATVYMNQLISETNHEACNS